MNIPKVIRDGKVAVLYSPGYGAGWSTWAHDDDLSRRALYSPEIVALVEADKRDEITDELCQKLFGVDYFYCGGARDLEIEWMEVGTQFKINEYDGSERIEYGGPSYWNNA